MPSGEPTEVQAATSQSTAARSTPATPSAPFHVGDSDMLSYGFRFSPIWAMFLCSLFAGLFVSVIIMAVCLVQEPENLVVGVVIAVVFSIGGLAGGAFLVASSSPYYLVTLDRNNRVAERWQYLRLSRRCLQRTSFDLLMEIVVERHPDLFVASLVGPADHVELYREWSYDEVKKKLEPLLKWEIFRLHDTVAVGVAERLGMPATEAWDFYFCGRRCVVDGTKKLLQINVMGDTSEVRFENIVDVTFVSWSDWGWEVNAKGEQLKVNKYWGRKLYVTTLKGEKMNVILDTNEWTTKNSDLPDRYRKIGQRLAETIGVTFNV